MRRLKFSYSKQPPGHGQHIYAYCNVRTNQVLYSLTQTLDSFQSLKQLPFIGPNTTPPKLRKDLWKPLWTLTLPPSGTSSTTPPSYDHSASSHHAHPQGLHAFRRLREYRKLHETCWEPTEEMKRNHTENEIEKLQKELEERGGSKKESVFDVIKRKKKKLRLNMVMDQKANSIADLAAVLDEQEKLGVRTAAEEERLEEELGRTPGTDDMKEKEGQYAVDRLLKYHRQAENDGIETLEAEIEQLRSIAQGQQPAASGTVAMTAVHATKRLKNLERKLNKTKVATSIMDDANRNPASEEEAAEMERLWSIAEKGGLVALQERMDRLQEIVRAKAYEPRDGELSQREARAEIRKLTREKQRMRFASEVVKMARDQAGFQEPVVQRVRNQAASLEPASKEENEEFARNMERKFQLYLHDLETKIEGLKRRVARRDLRDGETLAELEAALEKAESQKRMLEEGLRGVRERARKLLAEGHRNVREDMIALVEREVGEMGNKIKMARRRELEVESLEVERDMLRAVLGVLRGGGMEIVEAETEVGVKRKGEALMEREVEVAALSGEGGKEEKVESQLIATKHQTDYSHHLPSFPPHLRKPIFTMSGITVRWQNVLDAEFASAWPPDVLHEPMGITRYTAPKAGQEARFTAEAFKSRGDRVRRRDVEARRSMQLARDGEEEAVRVRGKVVDALKFRVVNRLKFGEPRVRGFGTEVREGERESVVDA